jgi:hypothetical protein
MKKFGIMAASLLALPYSALAQPTVSTSVSNLNDIIRFIKSILNVALPLIIAVAVVWFVWNMFKIFLAGDEEAKASAKTNAIYGIVGIFLMISVWGLVNILYNTFGLDRTNRGATVTEQLPSTFK